MREFTGSRADGGDPPDDHDSSGAALEASRTSAKFF